MSKNTLKRALCAILAVAMSASLLTACGNKKGGKNIGEVDEEGNITLTITHWENEATSAAMVESYKDFEADNPNIKTKLVAAPLSDYGLKLSQMIASNEAPDVFQMGHDMGVTYFQDGLTYDWTEKINAEAGLVEKYAAGTFDKWKFSNGTYFGLPGLVNIYGVVVNKDALNAAGLDIPTNDWTWDTLFEYAEKLKTDAQPGFATNNGWDSFQVAMMSAADGGVELNTDFIEPKEMNYDDTYIATIEKISKHIQSGAITGSTYQTDGQQDSFKTGAIPMMQYGQWNFVDLLNNPDDVKFDWDYYATPSGSKEKVVLYDCTGWVSPYYIKAPDEVWKFITYTSGPMYQKVLEAQPVAPSAYIDTADAFYDAITEKGHPVTAEACKVMVDTPHKTMIRFYPTWKDDANKVKDVVWGDIIDGKSPATDVKAMWKGVNEVIADWNAKNAE